MMTERVVVMAPNWLGDAVMALPAIGAVRQHHPGATLIVAARASTAALFRMVPGVDELVTLGDMGPGPMSEARALATARAGLAILLPHSFRSAFVARRAGIPERWGASADLRRFLLTRAVARPGGLRHQVDYYNCIVSDLGMPAAGVPARASALHAQRGAAGDAPVVGMAPGAAYGRAKQWPPGRFGRLAELLHERLGVVSVLVGSRADRSVLREMTAGPHLVDLIGETDLAALAGVMTRCRAFVSNDSGAMHLAAAAGVSVTAVFGATDERATAPAFEPSPGAAPHEILTCNVWCRPCMLRECPIDHRCMTGIDPSRVCDAVERQVRVRPESREP
jgi:heptosyltransferase-2